MTKLASYTPLRTLPLQICEQIAQSILEGMFMPGERLREVELAESFNVSRATIRESLRLLEQRGLVRILPQRGAHVTKLSAKELDDLFEIRASLLATGSRLAATRCGKDEEEKLMQHLARLSKSTGDVHAYVSASWAMIDCIVEISGNDVLRHYVSDFAQRIGRYVRMGLVTEERRKQSLASWTRLVKAMVRGDGDAAESIHRTLALNNRQAALKVFLADEAKRKQPAN